MLGGINKMEYRKLIAFGKSSFVVSLPKAWINKQNLQKGDVIYFNEEDNNLLLSASAEKKDEHKEIIIEVDGKDIKQIKREVFGAYIRNYKTITLLGNEIKIKAKDINSIIQRLMALEVMEQTSKKIVAKDFLNFDDVSIDNIIRKIDIVIRAMIEDCENMFKEDSYDSINYRDNDVNKLVFLVFRIVKYGYENPSYMSKRFNLNTGGLSNFWLMASHLESVADEVKRIARKLKTIELNNKEQKSYWELLTQIKDSYLQIMKSYYNMDVDAAHKVINQRESLIEQCEDFYKKNKNVFGIGFLVDRTKSMIIHVCHLGRVLYQG